MRSCGAQSRRCDEDGVPRPRRALAKVPHPAAPLGTRMLHRLRVLRARRGPIEYSVGAYAPLPSSWHRTAFDGSNRSSPSPTIAAGGIGTSPGVDGPSRTSMFGAGRHSAAR